MKTTTTLLIVDDNASVRNDLRTLIELTSKVKVIGEAMDFEDAFQQSQTLQPDIILVDMEMSGKSRQEKPGGDFEKRAFQMMRILKKDRPGTLVFVLTADESKEAELAAVKSGADAFFVKGRDTEQLLRLIRTCENK